MRRVFQSLLIFLINILIQILASANVQDSLVSQDQNGDYIGEVELEYNEHPQSHCKLDTYVDYSGDWMPWNWAKGVGKEVYVALMEMINAIWQLNVLLSNFTMTIVQEAFELDFDESVVSEVAAAIQNIAGFGPGGFIGNGLWPLLITFLRLPIFQNRHIHNMQKFDHEKRLLLMVFFWFSKT